MIRNSIRQLSRTPFKTILFLLLITVAGIFLSLGGCLWVTNSVNIHAYEEKFITIGTVEQKPASIRQKTVWDAELKDYKKYRIPEYSSILPISLLSLEGADYIQKPEKRSYYGSYASEYTLASNNTSYDFSAIIVEVSPLEDGIPDESMQVRVNKVLFGDPSLEGAIIWFCAHDQKEPEILHKEKNYVVVLNSGNWAHGDKYKKAGGIEKSTLEYNPCLLISTQYEPDGTLTPDLKAEDSLYFEVHEGFYDTQIGRRILNLAAGYERMMNTQPVTGTNATVLLMPFYNGDAYISEGRDIEAEEYEKGEHVCLVSKTFAENNQLSIGGSVHLQLYYTNCENSASDNFHLNGTGGFGFVLINAKGEIFPVFEDSLYTITGIYDIAPGANQGSYGMGGDEIIIPMASIGNRDKCNILAYGPMKGNTTSFQIPNGTIDKFMTAWEKYGSDELEITFYDGGYSKLKAGLDNMKHMSQVLLVVGLLMIVFILLFYSHLFITKQKERTAIERCLGMEKKKCRASLLIGILVILWIGGALGSAIGGVLSQQISTENLNKSYYDTSYSSMADVELERKLQEASGDMAATFIISLMSMGLIVVLGTVISTYKINQNLKCEPMKLLSEKKYD